MESLTGGTCQSGDPTRHWDETEQAALLGTAWLRQASPAMMSTLHDTRDLAHRLRYLVGPLAGANYDGGGHGGLEEQDGGATLVEATAKSSDALYRTTETLRRWLRDQDG